MLIGKSPVTAKVLRKIEAASTRVSGGIGKTVTESNTHLGHILVEGRDWKVQIPFYSDAQTSAIARDAALAVINSFDGAASHAAARQADQASTALARMPMAPPRV